MVSQRKIENYKVGINSIMSYLMDRAKVHFEVEDYDGYVDEMPFFSLHIYLKKAVYEHLIDMVLEKPKKYMDSSLSEEMAQAGVSVEWLKKEIGYKRKITSFVVKEKFSFIDVETYHKYVSALELFLMFTSFRNIVYHLYGMTIFPFESTMEDIQEKVIESTKAFSKAAYMEGLWEDWIKESVWQETYEEENEGIAAKEPYGVLNTCNELKDSLWFEDMKCALGFTDESLRKGEQFIPSLTDMMCIMFWKVKCIKHYTRFTMLSYVKENGDTQLAIYRNFLDRVLEVLQSPLFKLPSEFIYEVIRETYEGMYSLYFHFRANELTRGATKVCSREDMLNVSGRKRDAFFDRILPYSQSFTSEEIERFEKQLNLSFEHRIED